MIAWFVFGALAASVWLSGTAITQRSWQPMWLAAILSLGFSIITGFSVGPMTFLLTCLQFAAAVGIRRSASPSGWLALINLALLVWLAIVPLQIVLDVLVLPWLIAFPLIGLLATLAVIVADPEERRTA